jgi:hypothetical protein
MGSSGPRPWSSPLSRRVCSASKRCGLARRSRSWCRVCRSRGDRGGACLGSGIGSPPSLQGWRSRPGVGVRRTSPRPSYQRVGAPPDLTDSSGVKPGPVPGPCHPRTTSPGWRMVCCCTAAKHSNRVDRHRRNVPTNGPRRAEITSIDRSALSSGRRGRGFESRHPDTISAGQDNFEHTPEPALTR